MSILNVVICLDLNCTNLSNFPQLEVVSRYRDPQLQVGKTFNYLFQRFRG